MTTAAKQGTNPHAVSVPVTLRSLGAHYDPQHHGVYVTALQTAIDSEPSMRNIALTGAYGTGKSSVLSQIADLYEDRVLELSLSTVGADIDETDVAPGSATASHVKTLRIQKEIVKQILYRDAPARTRGSRFRRIARFQIWREVGVGLGVGAVVLGVLFLSGLSKPLVAVATDNTVLTVLAYLALLLVLASVVVIVRWATHNRVFLEKLSAGPATVSLATTQPTSYFDQYMDEIVYYFEQSGRDIVIFEDIDRFDEAHIFETLRALNTLLNGAEQVRYRRGHSRRQQRRRAKKNQRKRTKTELPQTPDVKFIYALRDSVFEKLGTAQDTGLDDAAEQEVKRANRTKFFDLVIPMVPFITHRNARDLMVEEMAGTGVSPELTDLAARHVADKRLIVNMRNEYDVFADRLLGQPSTVPGLDEDRLFAIILYKSVHMGDFEAVRLGKSQLDRLHTHWQGLIESCVDSLTRRSQVLTRRLADLDAVAARSERLGERLRHVCLAGAPRGSQVQIFVQGNAYDMEGVKTPAFWRAVIDSQQIEFRNQSYGSTHRMKFEDLQTVLGEDLDADRWARQDRAQLVRERDAIPAKLTFLRHHSWQEIYTRPEFTAEFEAAHGAESFRALADRLLRSDLARDMVAGGFVNDYFALYISMYYGRHLRRDALNFIVHALDQGEPSPLYPLEAADVEAILRDKGVSILRDRRIYNVGILDHLLQVNDKRTEVLIEQIATWGGPERQLAARYLTSGDFPTWFVGALAPECTELLQYLVSDAEVELALQVELVDASLGHLDPRLDYVWDETVARFVYIHYEAFDTLTSSKIADEAVAAAMGLIAAMQIELPDLTGLSPAVRRAAIDHSAYELNEANLQVLTDRGSIALDVLLVANSRIYDTAADRLDRYLEVVQSVHPHQYTVDGDVQLAPVLNKLQSRFDGIEAPSDLDRVVRLSAPSARVPTITDAPTIAWPALVAGRRTDTSVANLVAYLDQTGDFDDNLGRLLEGVETLVPDPPVDASGRKRLAIAVINAGEHLPSATQRTRLAACLALEDYVDVADLKPESSELAGLLIEADIIADEVETFIGPLLDDWSAREHAIAKSMAFATFLDPRVLPAKHLAPFFTSTRVDPVLKETVLERLDEFLPGGARAAANAAGRHALARRVVLNFEQLQALRAGAADTATLIELISRGTSLSDDELRALLRQLGTRYASIADPGTSRPLVPDDEAHRTIVARLQAAGVVSKAVEDKGGLRVSLFRSVRR